MDSEEGMSSYLDQALKSNESKKDSSDSLKENKDLVNGINSIDIVKIRQLEQKQELLVGLTNLLFKKFEEIHPTQKFSKFEFTDISWYKKLGATQ